MSDEELIRQILSGQKELYGDLVQKYQQKVRGHCFALLSNYTDSSEAAQDVFVKAYRRLSQFEGHSAFSTWLYRITVNHCLDILRQRKRRKTISLDALVEKNGGQIISLFSTSTSELAQMENRQIADMLFSRLNDEYRTILTLRVTDGLEYREMAEVLGCSMDTIKGRLSRARKQLNQSLRLFLTGC